MIGMERRNDYKKALLIEAAVHEHSPQGPAAAARALAGLGVPVEAAMRILTRPKERRHPGAPPEPPTPYAL
jgi:hypothetical protein